MPKSKRAKVVSLTQTDSKGLGTKKELVQQIHDACDEYARVFVFSVENMRNAKLKEVRMQWRDSRFFFGKNKVMSIAFGLDPETEYRTNMHEISKVRSMLLGENARRIGVVKGAEGGGKVCCAKHATHDTIRRRRRKSGSFLLLLVLYMLPIRNSRRVLIKQEDARVCCCCVCTAEIQLPNKWQLMLIM